MVWVELPGWANVVSSPQTVTESAGKIMPAPNADPV
jgi:hypothetical protein